jgi:hypothetical protein
MNRLPDWEARLSAYLAPLMDGAAFVWGKTDCALVTADAVLAMTGEDIAAPFRGKYSTAAGSARALKRYGAGDLKATFDTLLPPKPIGYARRGDVVMSDGAVGICIGGTALFIGERDGVDGLYRVDRAEWSDAWSVGE